MRNLLLLFSLTLTQLSIGQNANNLYATGDSLYKAKEYKNAAVAFATGIREEGKEASINRYWSLASNWSLAGETDSAFHYLNVITLSDKVNKVQATDIENDKDFIPVKNDKRWQPFITKIKKQAEKNGYLQEEFVYGRKDGMGLTLILIRPKVSPNGKAIISVQSGSWISRYNGIEINTQAMEQYLKKGYTMFAVMHGSSPRYAIPDAISDLKRAIRYIRYNAGKFGIDPDHIGITGGSAGGHLSLAVATADDKMNTTAPDPVDRVSSRVQAIAVLFPPTDLLNWGGPGLNFVNAKQILLINKAWGPVEFRVFNDKTRLYEEVTDTAARSKIGIEISPINFVSKDDPPVFIIHGDADPTVPVQQSKSIIARFNEAGVPNRFIIKKGGKHNGDDMYPEWQEFVDWFDKYLK
ncbi:MAG: prolyl oligopeptidase family serine peptidase [Chitinophagaceae bacterium]|nr:prolyl oligopeptidase family serine peptidase [Chitinophagaceae bacterium]